MLITRLERYTREGLFVGVYAGPGRGAIDESFERSLARLYEQPDTPRLSGVQIKAPMYLDADGRLSASSDKPFTHILKPAGTSGFESLPVIESMALALGRATGLPAPAAALVAMPDGMPPALLVERFDIREGLDDRRLIALEDLCSVLVLPPDAKYSGTIERVGRAIRALSTAPEEDLLMLLRRALFAWLIADGDMHLKNLALLKIAHPGDEHFREVRLSPLYDAVTTRIFPQLGNDRMAIKLNGKDNHLRRSDFRALAATMGLKAGDADAAIRDVIVRLGDATERLLLPQFPDYRDESVAMMNRAREIVRARLTSFAE